MFYILTRILLGSSYCYPHFDDETFPKLSLITEPNKFQSLDSKHGHLGPDPAFWPACNYTEGEERKSKYGIRWRLPPSEKDFELQWINQKSGEMQANYTKNVGKKAPERGVPEIEQHLLPLRNWTIGGACKFSRNIWFISFIYLETIPRPLIKNTLKIKTSTMNKNIFKRADIFQVSMNHHRTMPHLFLWSQDAHEVTVGLIFWLKDSLTLFGIKLREVLTMYWLIINEEMCEWVSGKRVIGQWYKSD